jgi:spermidine synthase
MPTIAIALMSAALLAHEVLLIRLFSIVQWHHFAHMAISIALLGYGASGTFVALMRDRLRRHVATAFALGAAGFGVTAIASFAVAERLAFNPLAVIWDPSQLLYLVAYYLLFGAPFFCGATCLGLALASFPEGIGRIYRADMMGAGTGALGIVVVLLALAPPRALEFVAALGLVAAAFASLGDPGGRGRWRAAGWVAGAFAMLALPPSWTALRLSEYKGLSQALLLPGARLVSELSSPLGLVSVVASPTIPFRHAPGLSLNDPIEPPPQLGLFTDGDGLSVITAFDGRLGPLRYLDSTAAALPYHLVDRPEVLILGAGGGADVLLALYRGARRIDAVELNPQVVRLVREDHADFAGRLYARPEVDVHVAEARGFVATSRARYDLIQIPLVDSFAAAAAGTLSLNASYLYTIEAFEAYLQRLRPGGYLAITRWLKLPPRDALKLFATALEALARTGVDDGGRRIALVRSLSTTTLLVKNGVLSDADIAALRRFADARSFDVAYYPGMQRAEADRYNRLDQPYFFDGAMALLGPERLSFLDGYKFDLTPATDDRPYFFDFFRWRALPELLERRTLGAAALLDWGYVILAATLAQATVLSLVLILTPLWFARRGPGTSADRWRVAVYFTAIGLAFLFVEIAVIQRFIRFLHHPLYATAVVLAAFLVFAGLGSGAAAGLARRVAARRRARHIPAGSALTVAVAGIAAAALLQLAVLPPLFDRLVSLPDAVKIAVSLALIAPLAFFMGMPFPLVLSRVTAVAPGLVPWAWGINGCASVLSALLATVLSMTVGFTAVIVLALGLYGVAAVTARPPLRAEREAVSAAP